MNTSAVKRWTRRVLGSVLLLGLVAVLGVWLFLRGSLAQLSGSYAAAGLSGPVTITRDRLGVPTIAAKDRLDVAYGTGFTHAQERFFQMDLMRRMGAGELSELFGKAALELDKSHRMHRFRARAAVVLQNTPPDDLAMLNRYVAGVNDGLQALGSRPFEYALIGVKPRAWEAADTLLVVWAMYFDLQGNFEARELARGWLKEHSTPEQLAFLSPDQSQWDAPLDAEAAAAPTTPIPTSPPQWWGQPLAATTKVTMSERHRSLQSSVGSNNWAVAGSRSPDGRAIVANDMHLGIRLPHIWYRAALQFTTSSGPSAGKEQRIVGVTLPGTPMVVVGSNGHVAWGFTNSYGDWLDLIALDTDAAHPGQVRLPQGWQTPTATTETLLVKGEPPTQLTVRETSLGPLREVAGRTYAVHWIAHEKDAVNLNVRKLEHALTCNEALAAGATFGIPGQNLVVGDAEGHIGWTIAGLMQQRSQPGVASTFPLSVEQLGVSWQGFLPPEAHPRVIDPPLGQINTANSRQLLGPGAIIIGDGGFDLGARSQQIRDDLKALGPKTTLKAVYDVALDDRAVYQETWRARALAVLDDAAVAQSPARAEFRRLLKDSWDGHASVGSVGYRLSRGFMYALYTEVFAGVDAELAKLDSGSSIDSALGLWPVVIARLLDEKATTWLPPGKADWRAVQLAAIDATIASLTSDGKPLAAATWGQRNTAKISHPIARAVPQLARWLSAPADQLPGDENLPRVAAPSGGQSERLTVSPGKEEEGLFNMPGGQSGHPLSPYFLAGHAEWVQGHPVPLLPGPTEHTLTLNPK